MKHRIVPMAIVLLELSANQVNAQTSNAADATERKEKPEKRSERIEVTGSRIRRIDVETSAPVQVIDKKEIEQSGVVSLGEVFRKSASSSPTGNFAGSSQYVSAGAATIDLLGLGGSRTLVLLNGKRLPAVGGLDSVNVDNIPVGIVERIEILSGGASAVYGADAVGGVVNIITRKDFTGTEVSLYKSFTQHPGGEELELTAVQGVTLGDNGNAVLAAGYRHRNRIDQRTRDLAYSSPERENTLAQQPIGTWSYRPVTVGPAPANSKTYGNWTPSANCPPDRQVATVPQKPNDVYCTGLRKDAFSELIPEKQDWYAAASFNFTLPSDWNLSSVLSFSRSENEKKEERFMRYAIDPLTDNPIVLSAQTAKNLGVVPQDATGDYFQVYAPIPEFPDRTYINTFDNLAAGVYLDGNVGEWKTSGGLAYASTSMVRKGKNIYNTEAIGNIFRNANEPTLGADPAYNPLDPNRDTSLLLGTFDDLESSMRSNSTSVDVFFSREMMDLPGGKFSLGLGASVSGESFKMTPDDRDIALNAKFEPLYTGTFANRGEGSRTITSVYSEFVAPLAKELSVEGALRFDHYSDFDNTANFGIGTKYSVLPWLGIRGRAASSFTAPTLSSLHQGGGGGYYSVTDDRWCQNENAANRYCDPANPVRQVYVDQPGNKDLKPEVGLNYIAGVILDPLPGLSLVSDYYWINLKKTFQTDNAQEIVDQWYEESGNATTGGTVKGNTVEVDGSGVISKLGLPIRNLGKLEVRAVDTKLGYSVSLGGVRYGYDSQYFRMLSYKVQEVQDAPLRQQVSYFGIPAWRWNNKLSVALKTQDFYLNARTIAPQRQDPETADASSLGSKVGVYTEYDFVYGLDLPWNGSLQLGVNNIFDTIGGKEEGNALRAEGLASDSLYSYVGRAYFARLTQRF